MLLGCWFLEIRNLKSEALAGLHVYNADNQFPRTINVLGRMSDAQSTRGQY